MKRSILVALLLFAACELPQASTPDATPTPDPSATAVLRPAFDLPRPPKDAERAKVLRVTDGDTIVLSGIDVGELDRRTGGRKARLIGIDTPEVSAGLECFGREATAFVERAIDGDDVLVDFDVDPLDRYGRALVYVWESDGTFFNGRLAAEGYALQATFPPNVRYVELFTQLVREAREDDRGLWSACN